MENDWHRDLERWLEPFLTALGNKTRRLMCPAYVAGLIGPGDRKSIQPMAAKAGDVSYDRLHHFISAGIWDSAPLEAELWRQADGLVGGEDAWLIVDDTSLPKKGQPVDWKLVTNMAVTDLDDAIEKLNRYALRWKAEVCHTVMKSGCRAEETRLQTAERLVRFLALISVISWRIFFLTMSARAEPGASPESLLTVAETTLSTRSPHCEGRAYNAVRLPIICPK